MKNDSKYTFSELYEKYRHLVFFSCLSYFKNIRFDIVWRPFQLNPNMPSEGMKREIYLQSKFGTKENIYSLL